MVKNLPASAGDVRDMGSTPRSKNRLEEGMAAHLSILAWRIPWRFGTPMSTRGGFIHHIGEAARFPKVTCPALGPSLPQGRSLIIEEQPIQSGQRALPGGPLLCSCRGGG